MTDRYIGEIRMFGGNFAPQGWEFCDGRTLAIAEYDTLYTLIGTTYGGDGVNTFNLPDLRGRIPFHVAVGGQVGEVGGAESVSLTTAQLPSHTHRVGASNIATSTSPAGHVFAGYGDAPFTTASPDVVMDVSAIALAGNNNAPFENRPPFVALTFIIASNGIFPSAG
ncbi:MAG: hypothetical protein QOF92_2850 [Pseudonocardiales bacterium]|nr:hypothetical protein [Pseudonocardiales bacterium]